MTPPPVTSEQELLKWCDEPWNTLTSYQIKTLQGALKSRLSPPPKAMERVQEQELARWLHEWFSRNSITAYLDHMPSGTPLKLAEDLIDHAMLTPGLVDREAEYSADGMKRVTRPGMMSNSPATSKEKP